MMVTKDVTVHQNDSPKEFASGLYGLSVRERKDLIVDRIVSLIKLKIEDQDTAVVVGLLEMAHFCGQLLTVSHRKSKAVRTWFYKIRSDVQAAFDDNQLNYTALSLEGVNVGDRDVERCRRHVAAYFDPKTLQEVEIKTTTVNPATGEESTTDSKWVKKVAHTPDESGQFTEYDDQVKVLAVGSIPTVGYLVLKAGASRNHNCPEVLRDIYGKLSRRDNAEQMFVDTVNKKKSAGYVDDDGVGLAQEKLDKEREDEAKRLAERMELIEQE